MDKGQNEIEKGKLKKIDVNLDFQRHRKRLMLIDEGQNEIGKGRFKKIDVKLD